MGVDIHLNCRVRGYNELLGPVCRTELGRFRPTHDGFNHIVLSFPANWEHGWGRFDPASSTSLVPKIAWWRDWNGRESSSGTRNDIATGNPNINITWQTIKHVLDKVEFSWSLPDELRGVVNFCYRESFVICPGKFHPSLHDIRSRYPKACLILTLFSFQVLAY